MGCVDGPGPHAGLRGAARRRMPGPPGMMDVRVSWTSRPGFEQRDPRSHLRMRLDGRDVVAVFDDTGALAGIELGFEGPDFYCFKDNLGALAGDLIARGVVGLEELQ
eukprot:gene14631-19357_t